MTTRDQDAVGSSGGGVGEGGGGGQEEEWNRMGRAVASTHALPYWSPRQHISTDAASVSAVDHSLQT